MPLVDLLCSWFAIWLALARDEPVQHALHKEEAKLTEYASTTPVLTLDDAVKPKSFGFPHYFNIVPIEGSEPVPQLTTLMTELNRCVDELDRRIPPDNKFKKSREFELRTAYGRDLRRIAEDICQQTRQSIESRPTLLFHLTKEIGRAFGNFEAGLNRVNSPEFAHLEPHDTPKTLTFTHPPEFSVSQQALLTRIHWAMTVVEIVLTRRTAPRSLLHSSDPSPPNGSEAPGNAKADKIDGLRSGYLVELKEIADTGLSSVEGAEYARVALDAFQNSFVAREADAVKNQHVKTLGVWASVFSLPLLLAAILTNEKSLADIFGEPGHTLLRNFLLLSSAASVGTWLSFSLRKVTVTFDDLAALEQDRLNPVGRLVFVILLTCVLGLVLEVNLAAISVGSTKILVSENPLMAIALGALCGIAERSLSGAVSRRAAGIVENFGITNETTSGAK